MATMTQTTMGRWLVVVAALAAMSVVCLTAAAQTGAPEHRRPVVWPLPVRG